MTNPPTQIKYGDYMKDLSELFTQGTSSIVTGYKLAGNADLGTFFSDISGATGVGYPIGFRIKNYNGVTGSIKDIGELFAANPYNNLSRELHEANPVATYTLTYTTTNINGYTVMTFTGGTGRLFIDSSIKTTIYYLIVAGGGPGGSDHGGGGGGGGVIQGSFTTNGSARLRISIGAGGIVTYNTTTADGNDSWLQYSSTQINTTLLTAKGGGFGGWASGWGAPKNAGSDGGCGGGAGSVTTSVGIGSQGKNGGIGSSTGGGGGGGMSTNGAAAVGLVCGNGGDGIKCTQNGISDLYPNIYWGGGGGGGNGNASSRGGNGGLGGGAGGAAPTPGTGDTSGINTTGGNGTTSKGGTGRPNTGGGGGGGPHLASGGNGGSGIVVIAYLTQS
jgi:hypothetical protein